MPRFHYVAFVDGRARQFKFDHWHVRSIFGWIRAYRHRIAKTTLKSR